MTQNTSMAAQTNKQPHTEICGGTTETHREENQTRVGGVGGVAVVQTVGRLSNLGPGHLSHYLCTRTGEVLVWMS